LLTKTSKPQTRSNEARELMAKAVAALGCLDHVRADVRVGNDGRLKVIEVNGIPGLKPAKSWSPQIFTLYHPSAKGPQEDYRVLINKIVESGLERAGLL